MDQVTAAPTGLDLDSLVAIDVHVHVEQDLHGHLSMDDELLDAAAKYFTGEPHHPTVPEIAAHYREQQMAVDGGSGLGSVSLSKPEAAVVEKMAMRTMSDPTSDPVTGAELKPGKQGGSGTIADGAATGKPAS